jgi:hypothetical protein
MLRELDPFPAGVAITRIVQREKCRVDLRTRCAHDLHERRCDQPEDVRPRRKGRPWNLHGDGEDQEVFRWTQIDAVRSLRDIDEKRARRRFGLRNNRPCRSEDGQTANQQETGSDLQTRLRALQNACAGFARILAGIIEALPPTTAFRDRVTSAGERVVDGGGLENVSERRG